MADPLKGNLPDSDINTHLQEPEHSFKDSDLFLVILDKEENWFEHGLL